MNSLLSQKLPKWHEVYSNEDERAFFVGSDGKCGLVRGKDKNGKSLTWRTVEGLAKDSGLTKKRVEELIQMFYKHGIVVNKPDNPESWAYYENAPAPEVVKSLGDADREDRLGKVIGSVKTALKKKKATASVVGSSSNGSPLNSNAPAKAPVGAPGQPTTAPAPSNSVP